MVYTGCLDTQVSICDRYIYVPAARPVAVAVVCAGNVFHEYVYGPTPPAGVAVAVPVDDPLHNTLTCVVPTVSATGWVIVTLAVLIHRLASVTVTIYVPAARPVAVAVICTGNVFHEYVYGLRLLPVWLSPCR